MNLARPKRVFCAENNVYAVTENSILRFCKIGDPTRTIRVQAVRVMQFETYVDCVRLGDVFVILTLSSICVFDCGTNAKYCEPFAAGFKVKETACLVILNSAVVRVSSASAVDFNVQKRCFVDANTVFSYKLAPHLFLREGRRDLELYLRQDDGTQYKEVHSVVFSRILGFREPYLLYIENQFVCAYDFMSKRKLRLRIVDSEEQLQLFNRWMCIISQSQPCQLRLESLETVFRGAYKFSLGNVGDSEPWMREAARQIVQRNIRAYSVFSALPRTRKNVIADLAQKLVEIGGAAYAVADLFAQTQYDSVLTEVMEQRWKAAQPACLAQQTQNILQFNFENEIEELFQDGEALFCTFCDGDTHMFTQVM